MYEFMATCPVEHHADFGKALDGPDPHNQKGKLLDLLKVLRTLNIPWGNLVTLAPLIAAFLANPATGAMPLIMAIIAILTPAPVPS